MSSASEMLPQHPRAIKSVVSTRRKTITTYSKNHPVQSARKDHFLTPDTPEIDWISSSKESTSKESKSKTGSTTWSSPATRRGSTLALRNISNIPLEKNASGTPCGQQTRQSNKKLPARGSLATKVSSMDNKNCKIYKAELQRSKHFKKTKKSKVLASTTTYSLKSMSCCSVCGGIACTSGHSLSTKQSANGQSLSTIKSMTLCHSSDDLDLSLAESQVLQPHNSTFIEEDLDVELKDIIPQDLSAILEEPVDKEQSESPKKSNMDTEISQLKNNQEETSSALCQPACYPRCSTPTDPENIQPLNAATQLDVSSIQDTDKSFVPVSIKSTDLKNEASSAPCQPASCPRCSTPTDPENIQHPNAATQLDVSSIQATDNIFVPVTIKSTDLKNTVYPELDTDGASDPDITPQTGSKKDCPTDVIIEPKQKRKLAYCVNKDKAPDCILLDVVVNRKKPAKVLFKQERNNSWAGINPSSFPVDVLL